MADTTGRASAVPSELGPWSIAARVGSGGMGVVYKAYRADIGDRPVALKVIRPGLLDDPAVQARFAREVEVLRRVRDVHISEFIDADLAGDPAWLATAFIDGPNLRDHIAAHGPLSEAKWWDLARGLAQALAVLEVHGITHRDMKPANVILSPKGPVLIDFGIAVPEDAASLTGTGLVTGSPAWLSPEQANLKPITTSSDVFSLGSLLTFAATGRPPFGTGAHVAVLLAIATRDPDTYGLSDDQRQLLAAMMAKDPAERPSARQVLQWTKHSGADVPPPPQTGIDAATQVIAPGSLDDTSPALPVTPAPPAAPPAQTGRRRPWMPLLVVLLVALVAGGLWLSSRGGESGDGGTASPTPSASATPTPTATPTSGPTPPAPGPGAVAKSGVFVLSPWSIDNAGGTVSVNGNVKNTGTEPATGLATVYVYSDGAPIASATAQLPEIPPGATVPVTFTGSDTWQPGEKSVALVVQ